MDRSPKLRAPSSVSSQAPKHAPNGAARSWNRWGIADRSNFARQRALVPTPQQPVGEQGQREKNHNAAERQQEQRREHARDVETIAGFDNAVGKAGSGARGAGCNLRN